MMELQKLSLIRAMYLGLILTRVKFHLNFTSSPKLLSIGYSGTL